MERRQGFGHPSSFHIHDPERIFDVLDLKEGTSFLDLGCGTGAYSRLAARRIGPSGRVFALDRRGDLLRSLRGEAAEEGLTQLAVVVADITEPLPVADGTVDVCFLCTVLHSLREGRARSALFGEMHRVLKKSGRAAVVECRKGRTEFGPPERWRLSEEAVDDLATGAGLRKVSTTDLGFTFLTLYERD